MAGLVCALILLTDLRGAIGFSSFGVLLYYLIANAAAYTQTSDRRRFPRALQIMGMIGCAILVGDVALDRSARGESSSSRSASSIEPFGCVIYEPDRANQLFCGSPLVQWRPRPAPTAASTSASRPSSMGCSAAATAESRCRCLAVPINVVAHPDR